MTEAQVAQGWQWHRSRPGVPAIGGSIASMFKSEGSQPPKALRGLFPSYSEASLRAAMFARETIANSWDAFWISEHEHTELELHFRFRRLGDADGMRFRGAYGLDDLGERAATGPGRRELGLGDEDCLSSIGAPVNVLEVVERWGGGMPGSWDAGDSALERALIKVGWAQREKGRGGSFGYGKAAVAQGSRINSLVVYTCFPDAVDGGVTRRILGATYWRPHDINADRYDGFAVFGDHATSETRPIEDDRADEVAASLGLAVRDPQNPSDWGSSFLIVDPSFGLDDLVAAVRCNWWPALVSEGEYRLRVFVTEDDGEPEEIIVEPDDELLGPFVEAFLAATADEAPLPAAGAPETSVPEVTEIILPGGGEVLGWIGLTVVPPSQAEGRDSLVALVRGPRMIVRYHKVASGEPFVRGVFVASGEDDINESLRQTEPPEHDRWLRQRAGDQRGEPADYAIAKRVFAGVEETVEPYRRQFGPLPPIVRGSTPAFSRFLDTPGATTGKTPPRPPQPPKRREIGVHLVHPESFVEVDRPTRREGATPGTLKAVATAQFELLRPVKSDTVMAEISIGARIAEEGGSGDPHPLVVTGPARFDLVQDGSTGTAVFRGPLTKASPQRFDVSTADYLDEWTVDLSFDAVVLPDGSADGS